MIPPLPPIHVVGGTTGFSRHECGPHDLHKTSEKVRAGGVSPAMSTAMQNNIFGLFVGAGFSEVFVTAVVLHQAWFKVNDNMSPILLY